MALVECQAPFGLNLGGSIPVSSITDYDVFHLVDETQLGGLASGGMIGMHPRQRPVQRPIR